MTDSPESAPLPAPLLARLAALLVDGLLWMPFAIGAAYLATVSPAWGRVLFPAVMILYVVYQVYFHARFGATLGKMAFRLRVVRLDQAPVDLTTSLKRSFVDAVFRLGLAIVCVQLLRHASGADTADLMALVKALQADKRYASLSNFESLWTLSEGFTALVNRQRRALHDLIAGTMVVKPAR
jgi:uncharacterized RDD family membrane protein YckC